MTLHTANASEVSGADFLRGLLGKAPLTPSEIAQREAEKRRLVAERNAQHEREMMEFRKRILAQFKTESGRAACLARFEAEGVDCSALTETIGDPMRDAA
jgi:hypothetical protein